MDRIEWERSDGNGCSPDSPTPSVRDEFLQQLKGTGSYDDEVDGICFMDREHDDGQLQDPCGGTGSDFGTHDGSFADGDPTSHQTSSSVSRQARQSIRSRKRRQNTPRASVHRNRSIAARHVHSNSKQRFKAGARPNLKGLRHFSMKVCEKVEIKGRTTYNEVADELVLELQHQEGDEKNIRRRVYDALNVLMAIRIISKEKKQIYWKGLPEVPTSELEALEAERARLKARIAQKQAYLQELMEQYSAQSNLIDRNKDRPLDFDDPQPNAIQLPFFLVQVSPTATVDVKMSEDFHDVHFDFHEDTFRIHDDVHVLRFMGLHRGAPKETIQAVPALPAPKLEDDEHGQLERKVVPDQNEWVEGPQNSPPGVVHRGVDVPAPCPPSNECPNGRVLGQGFHPQSARSSNGPGFSSFQSASPFAPWLGAAVLPAMPNHA